MMSERGNTAQNAPQSFLRSIGHRLHSTRLGDLLTASGLITPEQLDHALQVQRQTREPLGKILVGQGALSAVQLYRKLTEQWCLKASAAGLTMMMQVMTPSNARAEEPAIARVQLAVTMAAPIQSTTHAAAKYNVAPAANTAKDAARAANIAPAAAPSFAAPAAALRPQLKRGYGGLFGSTEVRSTDISAFTKWTSVMARFEQQMKTAGGDMQMQAWKTHLQSLSGATAREKVAAVNSYINQISYIEDIKNYGKSDHWATPVEFFRKGGDCEDFAIAKYASLRALGFSTDQLRIAIVQDKIKNIAHALLIVYTEEGTFVLDNQDKRLRHAAEVTRYQPVFSINATNWWLHRMPVGANS